MSDKRAFAFALEGKASPPKVVPIIPVPANKLTMLYFEQEGWWVAQCIECDIAMQAKTLSELFVEIGRVLAAHAMIADEQGTKPFEGLKPAPENFHGY